MRCLDLLALAVAVVATAPFVLALIGALLPTGGKLPAGCAPPWNSDRQR